ncbi:MAG: hypothetical protein RL454_1141, partial [Actinomycetota bacterium]
QVQGAVGEVEGRERQLAGQRLAGWPPPQAAGNHEVHDEEELDAFEGGFEGEAF